MSKEVRPRQERFLRHSQAARAPPIIKGDEKSTIYAKGTFLSFWQQILKVALVYRLSTMHHISLGARPK